MDIRGFLCLQCRFKCNRKRRAATTGIKRASVEKQIFNSFATIGSCRSQGFWQALQPGLQACITAGRSNYARECGDRRDERLGCGNAFFFTSMQCQHNIGSITKRAIDNIYDRNCRRATFFGGFLCRNNVGAGTGLRHGEVQTILQLQPGTIDRCHRGPDGRHRNTHRDFHQIFEECRRMVGRTPRGGGDDRGFAFLENARDFRECASLLLKQTSDDGRRLFSFLQHQGGRAIHGHSPIFNSATKS